MSTAQICQQFMADIQVFRWQEWMSTLMQIASVWYARKNDIRVYPTGILGVLLAAWVYFFIASPPLYADGLLNIYYFFMSVYGWFQWSKKDNSRNIAHPIMWCSPKERYAGLVLFLLAWLLLYFMLHTLTNSNTPVLDALVSSSAITAMWWMANRKIENWHAWIFSNIVAIPLNFFKGFILFTLMYVLFLLLAYLGYKDWKKELHIHNGVN